MRTTPRMLRPDPPKSQQVAPSAATDRLRATEVHRGGLQKRLAVLRGAHAGGSLPEGMTVTEVEEGIRTLEKQVAGLEQAILAQRAMLES